jgi:hypothetical protein
MSVTYITVTASYPSPIEGDVAQGQVRFRLTSPLLDAAGNEIVPRERVSAFLDTSGRISVVLAADDDAALPQIGVFYEVEELLSGGARRTYFVSIPADAPDGTVDLADLTPVVPIGSPIETVWALLGFDLDGGDPSSTYGFELDGSTP